MEAGTSMESKRTCWVCFASDEDDPNAVWLAPCKCKGSGRWVHYACLERWIDEKQKGDSGATVTCAQCKTAYSIAYPPQGLAMAVLEAVDRGVARLSPLVTGAVIIGGVYWTAVTYGAITVFEVVGVEEGLRRMEAVEPIILLAALPTIPVLLIVAKMVRWEETTLRLLDRIAPPRVPRPPAEQRREEGGVRDTTSATRVLCGALAFPTISVLTGRWLCAGYGLSPLRQAAVGGLAFLLAQSVAKIYYRHRRAVERSKRRIFNYHQVEDDDDPTPSEGSAATATADEDGVMDEAYLPPQHD